MKSSPYILVGILGLMACQGPGRPAHNASTGPVTWDSPTLHRQFRQQTSELREKYRQIHLLRQCAWSRGQHPMGALASERAALLTQDILAFHQDALRTLAEGHDPLVRTHTLAMLEQSLPEGWESGAAKHHLATVHASWQAVAKRLALLEEGANDPARRHSYGETRARIERLYRSRAPASSADPRATFRAEEARLKTDAEYLRVLKSIEHQAFRDRP